MESEIGKSVVHSIVHLVVSFPMMLLLIRAWVWWRIFELCELPNPSWMQTIAIAALIVVGSN